MGRGWAGRPAQNAAHSEWGTVAAAKGARKIPQPVRGSSWVRTQQRSQLVAAADMEPSLHLRRGGRRVSFKRSAKRTSI